MANIEEIKNDKNYRSVLDNGFVGLVDHMGTDESIVRAARVSYSKGTKSSRDSRGLIRYLVRHSHTSPLEMNEAIFHIKLPIFVMRQLVRHRTACLNEVSGRYSELTDEVYVPDLPQIKPQSLTNKQGRSGEFLPGIAQRIKNIFKKNAESSLQVYNNLLGNNHDFSDLDENYPGLARELARGVLTVNHYTELYWKMDLHNLLHFIRLREDSHAQWEIQEYARAILELIRPLWPITIEAWEDYIKNASKLSRMDQELLNTVIKTSNEFNVSFNFALDKLQGNLSNKEFSQTLGMSEREYVEWKEKFIKED
jgi:thymidylate synthase (FAD)